MHRSRFWPQNSLQIANTLKKCISISLQESEESKKTSNCDLTSFLCVFVHLISNKNSHACIKKLVKTLMEYVWKFVILTENLINFDATCSVILGTVDGTVDGGKCQPKGKL